MGATIHTNRAMIFAPSITLFDAGAPASKTIPEFVWVHCATEGLYKGHHQGEFNLTRAVFEAFVRNFRDDPQYLAGKLEVEVANDNGAKTYTGGIRPVIQFDYEHASEMPAWEGSIPTSGAPACGWALDVAIREGADGKAQLWSFAKLGDQIRSQIGSNQYRSVSIAFTLEGKHWVTGLPIGPVLTSIAFTNHPYMRDLESLAAANRAPLQSSSGAAGHGVKPNADPSLDPSEAPGSRQSHTEGDRSMTTPDVLRERICKTLHLRFALDDAAVGDAVEEAAGKASSLKTMLEALGVDKPEDAMKVIPVLRDARDKLAGYVAEIDAMLQQDSALDAEVAKVDIGAAMKAKNFQGSGAEKALGAYRAHCVSEELRKVQAGKKPGESVLLSELRDARKIGREIFLREYGVKEGGQAHLTQTFVAAKGGQQVLPPALPIEDRDTSGTIDLRGIRGANVIEKLRTHLSKAEPGFEKLPIDRQIQRASELRRTTPLLTQ